MWGAAVYSTGTLARSSVMTWSLEMGGEREVQERGDIRIHMADSLATWHKSAVKKKKKKASILRFKSKQTNKKMVGKMI